MGSNLSGWAGFAAKACLRGSPRKVYRAIPEEARVEWRARVAEITRIPVATVVGMVAEKLTVNEILTDFPQLSRKDVWKRYGSRSPWIETACRCRRRREVSGGWILQQQGADQLTEAGCDTIP